MNRLALVFLISATAYAQSPKIVSPEEFLGGAENAKMILDAEILAVERVSVPNAVTKFRWKDGHIESDEVGQFMWKGGPLTVEQGPTPVPPAIAQHVKDLLRTPVVDYGVRKGCGYLPTHRIHLRNGDRRFDILVIACYESFDVYLEGKLIGGRCPFQDVERSQAVISELDALLRGEKMPNQPPEPTALSVTICACAQLAPASTVAHL